MGFIDVNSVLVVIILVLVAMTAFCYDLGRSANDIKPGAGDPMTSIAMAAGLLTILTAVNVTVAYRKGKMGKVSGKKGKKSKKGKKK